MPYAAAFKPLDFNWLATITGIAAHEIDMALINRDTVKLGYAAVKYRGGTHG